MLFNPDPSVSLGQVGTARVDKGADIAGPDQWFSDLNSGSELPIGKPVAPDFGNPKSINERVDLVLSHLMKS